MKPHVKYIILILLLVFIIYRLYNRENFTENILSLISYDDNTGDIMVQSSTELYDQISGRALEAKNNVQGLSENEVNERLQNYVSNDLVTAINSGFDRNTYLDKESLDAFVSSGLGGYMNTNKKYKGTIRNGRYIFTPHQGPVTIIGASTSFNNYMEWRLRQVAHRTCNQTLYLSDVQADRLNRRTPMYFKEEWDNLTATQKQTYATAKEFVPSAEDINLFRLHSYLIYLYLIRSGATAAASAEINGAVDPTLPPITFDNFVKNDPHALFAMQRWDNHSDKSKHMKHRSYTWEKLVDKEAFAQNWSALPAHDPLDWASRVKKYHKYRKLALQFTYPKELYEMREAAKVHGFPMLPGETWGRSYNSFILDLDGTQQKNFRNVDINDINEDFIKNGTYAPFKDEDLNERRRNIYVGMAYFGEKFAREQALLSNPGTGAEAVTAHNYDTNADAGWDNLENAPEWYQLYLDETKASDTNDSWGGKDITTYKQQENPPHAQREPVRGKHAHWPTHRLAGRHISRFALGVKVKSHEQRKKNLDLHPVHGWDTHGGWYNREWEKSEFDKFGENSRPLLRVQAEQSLMNYFDYRRFTIGIKPGFINMMGTGPNIAPGKGWRSALRYWRGGQTYKENKGWGDRNRLKKKGSSQLADLDPDYPIDFRAAASV